MPAVLTQAKSAHCTDEAIFDRFSYCETFFERKEVYYYHDLPTITAHDCSRKDKSERAP